MGGREVKSKRLRGGEGGREGRPTLTKGVDDDGASCVLRLEDFADDGLGRSVEDNLEEA